MALLLVTSFIIRKDKTGADLSQAQDSLAWLDLPFEAELIPELNWRKSIPVQIYTFQIYSHLDHLWFRSRARNVRKQFFLIPSNLGHLQLRSFSIEVVFSKFSKLFSHLHIFPYFFGLDMQAIWLVAQALCGGWVGEIKIKANSAQLELDMWYWFFKDIYHFIKSIVRSDQGGNWNYYVYYKCK